MKTNPDGASLQGMITHWLNTPPNGYLGSSYGSDPQALLQEPTSSGLGDAFIDKMAEDIPLIAALPAGAVNVYFEDLSNDKRGLLIEVADTMVTVDRVESTS